jgi:hypothetical protein
MGLRGGTLEKSRMAEPRQMPGARATVVGAVRGTRPKEEVSMAEAYCVKDKQKVQIKNPVQITMKNGKPATKGTCPMCGGSVFRIGG